MDNVEKREPEVWVDIEGFYGDYEISSYGRVKSYKRLNTIIMKPKTDKDGYDEFCLTTSDKTQVYRRGHRLVGEAFIENPDNLPVIDHKDNSKANNYYKNLRWTTATDNTITYYKKYYQEGRTLSDLNKKDCQLILKMHKENKSYQKIADELNLSLKRVDAIGDMLSGRRLSTISGFKGDMRNSVNIVCQKLTDEACLSLIVDRVINKIPLKDLKLKYGVTASMVSRISVGKRRPEVYLVFKEKYL